MTNAPTVELTELLARTAHHGQVDKAGRPYVEHVRAVAAALEPHGPEAVMAGLLHDVVEDTHVTLDDLRELGYPPTVVSAVDSVTRRPDETYMDMIRRAAADPLGRLVKLADNAHNSDPQRLAMLGAEQAEWLRAKYAKARRVLEAVVSETPEPGVLTADEQTKADAMVADLHAAGYVDLAQHGSLKPGARIRHIGHQWSDAFEHGSGVVVALLHKPDSAWSESWRMPDVELVTLWDKASFGSRLSGVAHYHVEAMPDPSSTSTKGATP